MKQYALLIYILISIPCIGSPTDYWSINLPVPKQANNIQEEKNLNFYTISKSYDLRITDTETLYNLYDNFFSSMGWENPMKSVSLRRSEYQGKWSSYAMSFTENGSPQASYANMWKSTNIPALGSVQLTLTSYDKGVYTARVEVTITPEVDTSPLMELQDLMAGDPKNIFTLYEDIQANPFEIDEVIKNGNRNSSSNVVVQDYYKILDKVLANFKEFGDTYVHR